MEKNKELRVFAEEIRVETLKELANLGFGHIGGSMSVVELLAVLYGKEMRIDPKNPQWEDRDKLVMSKGHAGPAVYATLALKGYFPKEDLLTLNQGGTNFPSHCDRLKTTGGSGHLHRLRSGSGQPHPGPQRRLHLSGAGRRRVRRRPDLGGRRFCRPSDAEQPDRLCGPEQAAAGRQL